ncbi:cobalamin-binding protein [Planctomycetales bacterium ZRK34]|nr:cobalamin-binding protein [Planctomycetales bacterium ZRK34]
MSELEQLTEAIRKGDRKQAGQLTETLLDAETDLEQVLGAMVTAMDDIGAKFQRNEIFVPEMLIAARAMSEAMNLLEPRLIAAGIKPKYTAVIGTVQGDLHDIGKNLVAMMWKGAGFKVVDLGTNVTPAKFVEAAREHTPHVIGLSALLTTTMPAMKSIITALREAGLNGSKVVIGGAPITQSYADEIGADAYASDAGSAVDVVRQLVAA